MLILQWKPGTLMTLVSGAVWHGARAVARPDRRAMLAVVGMELLPYRPHL